MPKIVETKRRLSPIIQSNDQKVSGDRAEGDDNEGEAAVPDRMDGLPVLVLGQRIAAEDKRGDSKEQEVNGGSDPEEVDVEVGGLFGKFEIVPGEAAIQGPDLGSHEEEGQEQQSQQRKLAGNVLQLAADADTPACGVGRMMHDHPEERTDEDRDEELNRQRAMKKANCCGLAIPEHEGEEQRDDGSHAEADEASPNTLVVKGLGGRKVLCPVAHGLVGAGAAAAWRVGSWSAARSAAGTSFRVAFCER